MVYQCSKHNKTKENIIIPIHIITGPHILHFRHMITSNQSENIKKSGTAVNLICRSSKIMF